MKRLSVALLACTVALPVQAAKVVNRTIATVNGEAILQSEFEKNWAAFVEQQANVMPADRMTPDWKKDAKKKLLEQMISDKILLQEAKKRKVRVNQRDLENGVIQVKARFLPESGQRDLQAAVQKQMAGKPETDEGGPDLSAAWGELVRKNPSAVKEADAKFREELTKEGLTDKKFEERIKDQLSVMQLTSQEVRSRTPSPSDEQAKKLFEKLQQVIQGKDVQGADEEEVADLQSMAKFFQDQAGERVRARHILIRAPKDAPFKERSQAFQKAEGLRKKIQGGADFADLAEKNSDDKASAVQGGDLGFFTKGQMVPEFEKAAFTLPVGQVSEIVETNFGFHLIRVEEKRAGGKLKFEDVEDDLKEYLFRVNAQKTFEGYVNDLRKNSSVKVNINPEEIAQN